MSVMMFHLTGLLPVVFILSKMRLNKLRESIREHKWLKGEKGQSLTWDEAKGEWIRNLPPEKRRTAELAEQVEPFMLLDE